MITTIDSYKVPTGLVLMLRTIRVDYTSFRGTFNWPRQVGSIVSAPDWKPTPLCGNGIHGLLWGYGDSSYMHKGVGAIGVACEVAPEFVVWVGHDKIKVPSCRMVAFGDLNDVADFVNSHNPDPLRRGYRGVLKLGVNATAMVGDYGKIMAGSYTHAIAGHYGELNLESHSHGIAGYRGNVSVGYRGYAKTGDAGISISREFGTSIAGIGGRAVSGDGGLSIVGFPGQVMTGLNGRVIITSQNGEECCAVAGIDIEPDVLYRLNNMNQLVVIENG